LTPETVSGGQGPDAALLSDGRAGSHPRASVVEAVARSAIRNCGAYNGAIDERGRFAVSVYAAVRGVSVADILLEMPHKQYATARISEVRGAGFDIIPTTIHGTHVTDRVMAVHYDIVIPVDLGLDPEALVDPSAPIAEDVAEELTGPLRDLLEIFEPRVQK
jgi:hypothetical protein